MNQGSNQAGTAPREVGTLEGELHTHSAGISELAQTIDALESSLRNVLRPEQAAPPAPAPAAPTLATVQNAPSPAVAEVRQQQGRVQQLIARVNGMHKRLEG